MRGFIIPERAKYWVVALAQQVTRLVVAATMAAVFPSLTVAASASPGQAQDSEPIAVLQTYLRAAYARDVATAYPLVSQSDRAVKSRDEYAR